MLGCKNNRIDNLKQLARATAFRLAKEYQEKNKVVDSTKKIENKFTIKTNTKIPTQSKISQKTAVIDSRKSKFSLMKTFSQLFLGSMKTPKLIKLSNTDLSNNDLNKFSNNSSL